MTSSSRSVRRRRKATKLLLALSDDLLQEIFILVGLGSSADLIRASTACVAFRRLIADPTFLRRYRSLHPPLLLGTLCLGCLLDPDPYVSRFRAVDAPHPNAPLAGALASAADFSFSYLPLRKWHSWRPCDVRDGRVLLGRGPSSRGTVLRELAVCDPLTREYLLLPDIPNGLLATMQIRQPDLLDFEAFFIPSGGTEETPFEVICRVHSVTKSLVLVFSSGSGNWRIGTCTGWDSLSLNVTKGRRRYHLLSSPQWAHHCCYWKVCTENKLLKLDTRRMEFSSVDLPPDYCDNRQCVIVEAEEGKIAMFTHISCGTSVDYYTFSQDDGEKANNAWHWQKSIRLSTRYQWHMKNTAVEGFIFLQSNPRYYDSDSAYSQVFSLEIKTFNMEMIGKIKSKYSYGSISPYFGFPPSMSPRRIQGQSAGLDSHPGPGTFPVPLRGAVVRGNEDMQPFVYFSAARRASDSCPARTPVSTDV